jgi:hypothetical protein
VRRNPNEEGDQIKRIKDKYNKKFKEKSEEKPKFVKYKNVHDKGKKIKEFIIDSWDVEDKFITKKKELKKEEVENILEKEPHKLLEGKDTQGSQEPRKKQFSFQNIGKKKANKKHKKHEENQEIGGLLKSLGTL